MGKSENIIVWTPEEKKEYQPVEGATLLELLWEQGQEQIHAPCGGKGLCEKCTVFQVDENGKEHAVLACQVVPKAGEEYRLPKVQSLEVETSGRNSKIQPDEGLSGYGVACDIGTTTVVCHLIDLKSGARTATVGEGNAQGRYGADVISRIQAAGEGRLAELMSTIQDQLNRMIAQLCEQAHIEKTQINRMAIAANTTMCHLLTGLDPKGIGVAPFTPVSLFGECYQASDLNLCFDGEVYILPAVSGYVGGDITSDILAAAIGFTDKVTLMIDVGTNGEMALGSSDKMVCCSTAAGPAFEGAQIECGMTAAAGAISSVQWEDEHVACHVIGNTEAVGICGSGLIDAVAMMLDIGALDETGRMLDIEEDDIPPACKPYLNLDEEESPVFYLTDRVYVSQSDVRKLQLGKGAIAAGVQVLLRAYGIKEEQVGQLLLAGGFGSFIRVKSAARIGLIPQTLAAVTQAIGNAAADGACAALVSKAARERLLQIQGAMEYYELSGLPAFQDAYMEAMLFPEED